MEGAECQACGKAAALRCPTCIKQDLAPAYFCSQECFKKSWALHKLVHISPAATNTTNEEASKGGVIDERFTGYRFTGSLRPAAKVPGLRAVPAEIPRPEYAESGVPAEENRVRGATSVEVRTPEEIEKMRTVCRMSREVLDMAGHMVRPGITTEEIDRAVHEDIIRRGAYPSPLNYRDFPKSCCTSVNEVVCHGIPDLRPLQDGDIVNIDISLYYDGFHGDVNDTYFVGTPNPNAVRLVKTTYEALQRAIDNCVKPGRLYRDVGNTIAKHVHQNGFSVVRSYCGHGVGKLFHCAPNIPHYAKNKAVGMMKVGHIFTIEPMINEGDFKDQLWPDDWTCVTRDGRLSAQFEHTLLVTLQGVEVLTARTPNSVPFPWEK